MSCPIDLPSCPGGARGNRNPCPMSALNCPLNTNRFTKSSLARELGNLRESAVAAGSAVIDQSPELAEQIQQQAQAAVDLRDSILLEETE